jgi:hypothetical protein
VRSTGNEREAGSLSPWHVGTGIVCRSFNKLNWLGRDSAKTQGWRDLTFQTVCIAIALRIEAPARSFSGGRPFLCGCSEGFWHDHGRILAISA